MPVQWSWGTPGGNLLIWNWTQCCACQPALRLKLWRLDREQVILFFFLLRKTECIDLALPKTEEGEIITYHMGSWGKCYSNFFYLVWSVYMKCLKQANPQTENGIVNLRVWGEGKNSGWLLTGIGILGGMKKFSRIKQCKIIIMFMCVSS